MKIEKMLDYVTIVKAAVPAIPSSTAVTVVEVDASGGYDRCLFIVQTGAMNAASSVTCKVTEAATSGGTAADITSAALTGFASGGASKVYTIDVPVNNAKPYLKLAAVAVANTVAFSAVAILYNGSRMLPPANTGVSEAITV